MPNGFMNLSWLKFNKLNLFLSLPFWLFQVNSILFNFQILLVYGNLYGTVSQIMGDLLNIVLIYLIVSIIVYFHLRLSDKYNVYNDFWTPEPLKIKLTVWLTSISTISYILFFIIRNTKYSYIFFLIAALLNILPSIFFFSGGPSIGILHLPSFLSSWGFRGDNPGDPWVNYTKYFIIIPIILLSIIWTYFLSCIIVSIISIFRK